MQKVAIQNSSLPSPTRRKLKKSSPSIHEDQAFEEWKTQRAVERSGTEKLEQLDKVTKNKNEIQHVVYIFFFNKSKIFFFLNKGSNSIIKLCSTLDS